MSSEGPTLGHVAAAAYDCPLCGVLHSNLGQLSRHCSSPGHRWRVCRANCGGDCPAATEAEAGASAFEAHWEDTHERFSLVCSICGVGERWPQTLEAHVQEDHAAVAAAAGQAALEQFRRSMDTDDGPTSDDLPPVECSECSGVGQRCYAVAQAVRASMGLPLTPGLLGRVFCADCDRHKKAQSIAEELLALDAGLHAVGLRRVPVPQDGYCFVRALLPRVGDHRRQAEFERALDWIAGHAKREADRAAAAKARKDRAAPSSVWRLPFYDQVPVALPRVLDAYVVVWCVRGSHVCVSDFLGMPRFPQVHVVRWGDAAGMAHYDLAARRY